jgi:hypothetical protein
MENVWGLVKKSISEQLNMDELKKRVQAKEEAKINNHATALARRQEVSVESTAEEKFLRDMKEAGVDYDVESGKRNVVFEKNVVEEKVITSTPTPAIVSMQSANMAREQIKSGISLFGSVVRNSSNSIMNGVKQIGSKISQTASSTMTMAANSSLSMGNYSIVQQQRDDARNGMNERQPQLKQVHESVSNSRKASASQNNDDSSRVVVMKSSTAPPGINPASMSTNSKSKSSKVSKEMSILIAIIVSGLFVWWWM